MSTTKQQQYERLRKLFNSAIQGKNTEALLWALANPAVYLINNLEAIHDNVYIATASERYLEQRLADFNLVKPPKVGLSDDVFRDIGISVINRKQVRELITSILSVIFGKDLTQATAISGNIGPYNLDDGDKLRLKFDGTDVVEVTFNSSQFQNINTASAQEVADAITKSLRAQGKTGRAFAQNDGSGEYVIISSDTEGPQSSVVVLGGRAQNELLFEKIRPTTGGPSTQWTVAPISGSSLRFTWSGGANPSVGKVRANDYVNIFGSAFNTNNQGTFTVTSVKGGTVGNAYFEVENPTGVAQVVSQGTSDAVLFFQPIKNTLSTKNRYAALFQEESRLLEIFIPATTKVVKRDRKGASHIHMPILETKTYDPGKNKIVDITFPAPGAVSDGDYFEINSANNTTEYYVYLTTSLTPFDPAIPGKTGIQVNIIGLTTATQVAQAVANILNGNPNFSVAVPPGPTARICWSEVGVTNTPVNGNISGLSISVFQEGVDEDENTTSTPNPDELLPDQQGPYIYDLTQPFVLSNIGTNSTLEINPTSGRIITVVNSLNFPDDQGFLILNYGTDLQEGPVPYLGRPSNTTLLLSPAYQVINTHPVGSEIRLIAQNGPIVLSKNGDDFPAYLTDVISGREYAENLIKEIAATGINLVITILYPGDEGLSKYFTLDSEKVRVWGGDSDV